MHPISNTKMVLQWIDNSIISHSRWRSPTNKLVWANYSTDQKNFTGHMFTIKLEEKSYKISFKALPFKIHWSKNRQRAHCAPSLSGPDRVKKTVLNIFPKSKGKHLHQRLFSIKLQVFFFWNFWKHFIDRTSPGGCFYQ